MASVEDALKSQVRNIEATYGRFSNDVIARDHWPRSQSPRVSVNQAGSSTVGGRNTVS